MEIKPGKYKMRCGLLAVVTEIFEHSAFGRYLSRDGNWYALDWGLRGERLRSFESSEDLIAPWEEPKPKPRLRFYRIGWGIFLLPESESIPKDWEPVLELNALFEKGKE